MHPRHLLAISTVLAALPAVPAWAAEEGAGDAGNDIVVTARKREESLKDVPIAATAVTGESIERKGLVAVKDVAMLTPSLSINSDGAGRAFIAIRGIGTTLIDSVQPGVGIFVDGIYQPNTSYLNNPMSDVERVEVLRGPQGTLYGKNTLGGAINVITRQPTNEFRVRAIGSYAGPDNAWTAGASVSGPIVADTLLFRAAYTHQQQEGFVRNTLVDADAFPYETDAASASLVVRPTSDVKLTVNGYYSHVKGGGVSYAFVTGPTDYNRDVRLNATNYQLFKYRGINGKLELPLDALSTRVTLIGAYDRRGVRTPDADPDFTAGDVLRSNGTDDLKTRTAELRFDSELSPTFSSILGAFYSRETRVGDTNLKVLGLFTNTTHTETASNYYALFGNLFWRPNERFELSAGVRWDQQKRSSSGEQVNQFPVPGTVVTPPRFLKENNVSPRVALTWHVNDDLMAYASVARGTRGGGFNPLAAPANLRTYKGDQVWTYELGSKYASPDRRVSLSAALFYNDYKDYIGLNSIYRATGSPTFTTVDLNTGDVRSYGIEVEGTFRPADIWTLSAGASWMHARIVDSAIFSQTLNGRKLASDRIPFQPDWNFHIDSDVTVPVGNDELGFNLGLVGKGSRIAASLSETNAPVLKSYILVNGTLSYRTGPIELSTFVTNLFNKNYMESYIEKTTLILAGLPASDVGIAGERRRYGVRARLTF